MKNYLVIDGKQIPLSGKTVKNFKKELGIKDPTDNYLELVKIKESSVSWHFEIFEGSAKHIVRIGYIRIGDAAVPEKYIGKCLIVDSHYKTKVLPNPLKSRITYPEIIVFEKKTS